MLFRSMMDMLSSTYISMSSARMPSASDTSSGSMNAFAAEQMRWIIFMVPRAWELYSVVKFVGSVGWKQTFYEDERVQHLGAALSFARLASLRMS